MSASGAIAGLISLIKITKGFDVLMNLRFDDWRRKIPGQIHRYGLSKIEELTELLNRWSSAATAAPHPAWAQRSRLVLNRLQDYQPPGRLWRCVRERAE